MNTVVCSRHFRKEDFRWTATRKCLQSNAVPSLFDWQDCKPSRKPHVLRLPPTPKDIQDPGDDIQEHACMTEITDLTATDEM